jgi:hypothetical protein
MIRGAMNAAVETLLKNAVAAFSSRDFSSKIPK